jgi:hypothetical protein
MHEGLKQDVAESFYKPIFAVSQVRFARKGRTKSEGSATGFFYAQDSQVYFITN